MTADVGTAEGYGTITDYMHFLFRVSFEKRSPVPVIKTDDRVKIQLMVPRIIK